MLTEIVRIEGRQISQNRPHLELQLLCHLPSLSEGNERYIIDRLMWAFGWAQL